MNARRAAPARPGGRHRRGHGGLPPAHAAELVAELAQEGSIDAVLARHAGLAADDIREALRRAADLLAAERPPDHTPSSLYRAYNGFVAALFSGSSTFFGLRHAKANRNRMLRRLSGFLLELADDLRRPLAFAEGIDDPDDAIDRSLRELDEPLADYFQVGIAAFRYTIARGEGGDAAKDAARAERKLLALGHPPMLFRSQLDGRLPEGRSTLQDVVNACLRLLREIVAGVPDDERTCFVAMPFTPTFESRYTNFYRNVARRLGLRALRAWGGIAGEEHQELLLVLIARSGALLGDVTEPNANVALEIGFALGEGKHVLLVAERSGWRRAANVQLDWVYPYRVDHPEWELDEGERAGLYFTALMALRRPGVVPSWSAKPLEALQQLLELTAPAMGKRARKRSSEPQAKAAARATGGPAPLGTPASASRSRQRTGNR